MADMSIFGLPIEEPSAEETTSEDLVEETPVAEAPVEETVPEADPEPAPEAEEPAAEEAPEAEVAVEETAAEEAARLWANKYKTPEDLERGYSESREMWRRANEARRAEAQKALELEEQNRQLMARIQAEIVPTLQQAAERERQMRAFAEEYRRQYGEYPRGMEPLMQVPEAPALTQQSVEQAIEQRLQQERTAMAQQFQEQQYRDALQSAVNSFYQDHPEVEPGGALDTEITDTLAVLNESWDRFGIEIDPTDRGSLDTLYEISRDPALLEVLKMRPEYFESAWGMELARRDAAVISGRAPATTVPTTQQVPASQVKTAGQRKPFAESASTGASMPNTADQNDPWARIQNAGHPGETTSDGRKAVFFE